MHHRRVNSDEVLRRPIGWWLKEADRRLDGAFEARLSDLGATRREWQIFSWLSRSPGRRADLHELVAAFDPPALIDAVIDSMIAAGWVVEDDLLALTPAGKSRSAELAPIVDEVREQVREVLPGDDYRTLVTLLARIVTALPSSDG